MKHKMRLSPLPLAGFLLLGGLPATLHYAAETVKKGIIPVKPIDPEAAAKVSYVKDIHPLLDKKCSACHGPDGALGGLDVTTVEALRKGGRKAGPSIIDGKPDDSPLVQYIQGIRKPIMPKGGKPLTQDELHLIRQWIQAGAKDDSKPEPPKTG